LKKTEHRFIQGAQAVHPAIRFARSHRFTVTALTDELQFHIDGESICTNARQLNLEILPESMEIITG